VTIHFLQRENTAHNLNSKVRTWDFNMCMQKIGSSNEMQIVAQEKLENTGA
jgi:hypothetical protein